MKVLVLGANGETGINVVTQLLKCNITVKALERHPKKFESIKNKENLEIIVESIFEVDFITMKHYLEDVRRCGCGRIMPWA